MTRGVFPKYMNHGALVSGKTSRAFVKIKFSCFDLCHIDVKAYYAAFIEKQQELEKAAQKQDEAISDGLCGMSNNRQVGMNSKCEVGEEEASVVDKYVKHQLK